MIDILVAGEPAKTLLVALGRLSWEEGPDGMKSVSARLEPALGTPFARALMRIQAELLLHDANTYGQPDAEARTDEQRAADALVALALRVSDALRSAR